jgi:non-specific serine/threonine protein kinase
VLAAERAAGRPAGEAGTLGRLGLVALQEGDYATARALLSESLDAHRQLVGDSDFAFILCRARLGHVAHAEGDLAGARALYEQSLAVLAAWDDKRVLAGLLVSLALVDIDAAAPAAARARLEEGAALVRELQDRATAALCLDGFAGLAAAQGQPARALRLAGAAARLRQALGAAQPRNLRDWVERHLGPARRALTAGDRAARWADGQAMSLEEALGYALAPHDGAPRPLEDAPGDTAGRAPSPSLLPGPGVRAARRRRRVAPRAGR